MNDLCGLYNCQYTRGKALFVIIFATKISCVLIFVLGQIVVKFVIEPIKELKDVLGGIHFYSCFMPRRFIRRLDTGDTVLGTPCLTVRWNTERPVTLLEQGGASVQVGNDVARIRQEYRSTLAGGRKPVRPQMWDGQTAPRCLQAILDYGLHT
jgi:hypothetical protein